MLSKKLLNLYQEIVSQTSQMVNTHVDTTDITGLVDYASIYAQSPEEFEIITKELQNNGSVAIEQPSGNYYSLTDPLETSQGTIKYCRVRKYDTDHPERGYADFEVVDYPIFKEKYLSEQYFSLLDREEEMIELRDPKFNVRAYFLSGQFYL